MFGFHSLQLLQWQGVINLALKAGHRLGLNQGVQD